MKKSKVCWVKKVNRMIYICFLTMLGITSCKNASEKGLDDISEEIQESKDVQYDVILLGGQSNMVGHGRLEEVEVVSYENQLLFDFGLTSKMKKTKGNFGPEIGVSKVLAKNTPNKKYILIKYGIGGSSLLDWAPDYSVERAEITGKPEFGNMYATLMAKVDSITVGLDTKIRALLWMQGERDARVPLAGKDYYGNFETFILAMRRDTDNPELPIIFGEINPPKLKFTYVDSVVAAQRQIDKNIPHTYLIATADLTKKKDSVHYDSEGQLELGRRMGESLMKALGSN